MERETEKLALLNKQGPIIVIDDDNDDQEIVRGRGEYSKDMQWRFGIVCIDTTRFTVHSGNLSLVMI